MLVISCVNSIEMLLKKHIYIVFFHLMSKKHYSLFFNNSFKTIKVLKLTGNSINSFRIFSGLVMGNCIRTLKKYSNNPFFLLVDCFVSKRANHKNLNSYFITTLAYNTLGLNRNRSLKSFLVTLINIGVTAFISTSKLTDFLIYLFNSLGVIGIELVNSSEKSSLFSLIGFQQSTIKFFKRFFLMFGKAKKLFSAIIKYNTFTFVEQSNGHSNRFTFIFVNGNRLYGNLIINCILHIIYLIHLSKIYFLYIPNKGFAEHEIVNFIFKKHINDAHFKKVIELLNFCFKKVSITLKSKYLSYEKSNSNRHFFNGDKSLIYENPLNQDLGVEPFYLKNEVLKEIFLNLASIIIYGNYIKN